MSSMTDLDDAIDNSNTTKNKSEDTETDVNGSSNDDMNSDNNNTKNTINDDKKNENDNNNVNKDIDTRVTVMNSNGVEETRDISDVLEERLIDAEYKIWKKNTPYLYDFVITHSLEWPSLTCQWLPNVKNLSCPSASSSSSTNLGNSATSTNGSNTNGIANGGNSNNFQEVTSAVEHNMLIGTHTTGEQNYLMVASVNLPKGEEEDEAKEKGTETETNKDDEEEGTEIGKKRKQPSSSGDDPLNAPTATNYDEERGELGGFGAASSGSTAAIGRVDIKMKIKHEGEVNRARHMPQNHFIVASRGPDPQVFIWDLSKHPSVPDASSGPSPQAVCIGHSSEGYGTCWSPHREGHLVTASEDTTVCLWGIQSALSSSSSSNNGRQIHPISTFRGHTQVVEDVDWHHRDANLIGSVGDDKTIQIWDTRKVNPLKAVHSVLQAHKDDINTIAFNPVNEFIFATGSADTTVALWDLRNLKTRVQTFTGHTDQVYNIAWAPHNESILASCSSDRRVGIWDMSRIGMEQTPEDAEDGPPELLFLHGGHTSKVSDFSWNLNDEWTIASVAEDNVLQVWNMAEEVYAEEEDIEFAGESEEGINGAKAGVGALQEDELE